MWAAFVRQIAAFAITQRGKKMFALIGVLLLCFGAALLVDLKLYFSAAFTTILAVLSGIAYLVQHFKLKRLARERLARKAEAARRRALAAQARLERIDNAKGALGGAVRDAARTSADAVSGSVNEAFAFARETAQSAADGARGSAARSWSAARASAKHFSPAAALHRAQATPLAQRLRDAAARWRMRQHAP